MQRLPAPIAIPLTHIARHLEVPPVATYAAVCLWNFKPLFIDEHIDNLENLATLYTFTGSIDESWFYLVSVAIEGRAAPTLPIVLTAMGAARRDDAATVTNCLREFAETIDELGTLLQRMHESCDPHVFYNRIRPFLAGWKNMSEAGLPNGVLYEDGSAKEEYKKFAGGSNAQSSILQFFDIALGITHRPTGEKNDAVLKNESQSSTAPLKHNFLLEMREYMPGPHRRFLEDVAFVANIRQYVECHTNNADLCLAYDACLAMLQEFRNKHINIVSRFIVIKSRESRPRSRSPQAVRQKVNLATASRKLDEANKKNIKGTGGTALIPFLKQARDETGEPAIAWWARRVFNKDAPTKGSENFFTGKLGPHIDDSIGVGGLAGSWTIDDEIGGLCQY